MAKRTRTRGHSRSHKRTQRKGRGRASRRALAQRGGMPASAWGWQLNNLGDGWTQFMNSMKGTTQSNVIVPNSSPVPAPAPPGAPTPDAPKQAGGRRRARTKRGGNWGTVIGQAAVPAAIWTMQYKTKRRHRR